MRLCSMGRPSIARGLPTKDRFVVQGAIGVVVAAGLVAFVVEEAKAVSGAAFVAPALERK